MRKALTAMAVAAFAGLLIWRLWQSSDEADTGGRGGSGRSGAVAVEAEPVRRGEIRDLRVFTGTLQPRARFVFAPKIGGRLEELRVDIGDPIRPGQVIARIDDEEYVQQVNQAKAALEVAQAAVEQEQTSLTLAQREMERIKALREKRISSEAEWDTVEAKFKAQAAQVRLSQAQMAEKQSALRAAEVRLSYARIVVPNLPDGGAWRVEERYVDEGAMLTASAPLVSVVDLGCLTAVVQVIEKDYPSVSEGLAVDVATDAYPGRTFAGRVTRIAPALREASRQARVEIEIVNEGLALRPGMFVRARMEFARHEDALLVPRGALARRHGEQGLFVVSETEKTARFVPAKIGIVATQMAEVLEPKIAGRVVTLGQHLLADGTKVILQQERGDDVAPTAVAAEDGAGKAAP